VGYAGGTRDNPTYRQMGDHTEALQVDYDPSRISFEELLDYIWESHNPFRQAFSRQYMNLIFYHDEEQQRLVLESLERLEREQNRKVATKILPYTGFYLAENYHQKYYLQNTPPLLEELQAIYPRFQEIIDSTAAARINGYIAGYGEAAVLAEELPELGLSPQGADYLMSRVR